MTYRIHFPAEVAGDYPELAAAVMACDMMLDTGARVGVRDLDSNAWFVVTVNPIETYVLPATVSVDPDPTPAVWSVWVGGVEMNDHYMTETQAAQLADVYRMDGYDDVTVSARS